ncbi:hypothetical protein MKX08_002691 [Trichoderma sp. CBMAI-0020]|nr:hypothetical protein MKX08_002691 [Trichoderma sp. CBMAI-0020]
MNLAASTKFAADTAANGAAAPYIARATDADIASSAATLGKSRLFDVGGCGKGSSNESKEDGGGLHFDGLEESKRLEGESDEDERIRDTTLGLIFILFFSY